MFNVYAIGRDGQKHGDAKCSTLEDVVECLEQAITDDALFAEFDGDAPLVRFGITFAHDGAADLMQRCARPASPNQATWQVIGDQALVP